jgi:hypothetical protein
MPRRSPQAVRTWRWATLTVLAVAFFLIAINGDIYNLTSPPAFTWHVLLRKIYSIAAFALVGGVFIWASGASLRTTAIVVALYSGAIEIGQHITVGHEPLYWNVIDVFCGALGGALAAFIPWFRAK